MLSPTPRPAPPRSAPTAIPPRAPPRRPPAILLPPNEPQQVDPSAEQQRLHRALLGSSAAGFPPRCGSLRSRPPLPHLRVALQQRLLLRVQVGAERRDGPRQPLDVVL